MCILPPFLELMAMSLDQHSITSQLKQIINLIVSFGCSVGYCFLSCYSTSCNRRKTICIFLSFSEVLAMSLDYQIKHFFFVAC